MAKNTAATVLPGYQTQTIPWLTGLYHDSMSPTGSRVASSPSLPASPSPLQSSIPSTLHGCLLAALPGLSKEPTLRSATLLWLLPSLLPSLPTTHRAVTGLATSPLLHFSFHHFSLPTIFKVLARGSKMVHLVNHPSTAWARWWLAPVLTHVHAQK